MLGVFDEIHFLSNFMEWTLFKSQLKYLKILYIRSCGKIVNLRLCLSERLQCLVWNRKDDKEILKFCFIYSLKKHFAIYKEPIAMIKSLL